MTQQQSPTDVFNNFLKQIQSAQSSILCGPDCQRKNEEEKLHQEMIQAKTNYEQDPAKVKQTYKDYFIFKNGSAAYNEEIEKKYHDNAEKMIETYKNDIDMSIKKINTEIIANKAAFAYFNNIQPAFKQYHKENNHIQHNIKQNNSSTITNNRKTAYENEGLEGIYTTKMALYSLYYCIHINH